MNKLALLTYVNARTRRPHWMSEDDDVYAHSFKRTTAWMIMKIKAQIKHVHVNEALASKQLTPICDKTVDDVFLSFSMLSICPFQLINVVFLTLSPPLLFAIVLFAAIYSKYQVHLFIYLLVLVVTVPMKSNLARQTNPKTQTVNITFKNPNTRVQVWPPMRRRSHFSSLWSVSEHQTDWHWLPFPHRSSEVNVQTNECHCLWSEKLSCKCSTCQN